MAYKSFLIQQYNYTHENVFFRVISSNLKKEYENEKGLHILIGNISCNGHQIDALFISNGKIIVIDFKNYGGRLVFSENNPWQIFPKGGKSIFVSGGNSIRNPYQQVMAYRNSLFQLLEKKDFVDANHPNLNLRHISGMVIFHQPIELDSKINDRIQYYFDVVDNDTCIERIKDRFSGELNLSDNEIEGILRVLDVRAENLYDETEEIKKEDEGKPSRVVERLQAVKKIIENVEDTGEYVQKILNFYEVLLNLERQKEPSVKDEYHFSIDWEEVEDVITISLKDNEKFGPVLLKNQSEQFSKNIFVGINVSVNDEVFPLLYTTVDSKDILSYEKLDVSIKEFELYSKPLEDRQYPDNDIETIANEIVAKNNLQEKIEILQNHFGEIRIEDKISLALSEESPFTAPLLSELRKIKKENLVKEDTLLEKFLLGKEIHINNTENSEKFIQITALTSEQRKAVESTFHQPLSVITGPPGTGKTQVIVNILANAILHNKKILVASKNNQAVDNVKEKLDTLLAEPNFFLRFGNRIEVREKVAPIIRSFVSKIHHKNYTTSNEIANKIDVVYKKISKYEKELNHKYVLEKNIQGEEGKIIKQEKEIALAKENYNQFLEDSRDIARVFRNIPKEKLQSLKEEYTKTKNEILSKYSGISKLIFNWFYAKKYAISLVSSYELWEEDLKKIAKNQDVVVSLERLSNGENIITTFSKLIDVLSGGEKIQTKKQNFEQDIKEQELELDKFKKNLKEAEIELEKFLHQEKELRQNIKETQEKINELSIPLLDEKINNKLSEAKASDINGYIDYIPDNVPWKNEEIPMFVKSAKGFLETFNLIAVTNLSIKTTLPLANELFDMVVIDEASQCDVISAIPLILRAKQVVVIGDPMQLKHISKIQGYEQDYVKEHFGLSSEIRLDYVNKSLYDYCYDLSVMSNINSVFLKDHFRCHPEIVGYSNEFIYKTLMGQEMNIHTSDNNYRIEPKGIIWKNVRGRWQGIRKQNNEEIEATINLSIELIEKNPTATIGITSPFRDQINAIKDRIPTSLRDKIKADVIHSFQGQERDIMIFSTVVTNNTPDRSTQWINKTVPFLINVAVTRAKNTLYVVGNLEYAKKLGSGKLYELANYVKKEKIL